MAKSYQEARDAFLKTLTPEQRKVANKIEADFRQAIADMDEDELGAAVSERDEFLSHLGPASQAAIDDLQNAD